MDDRMMSEPPAGPSRPSSTFPDPPTTAEIPSYGLQFFEYRRRLFLAGQPLPDTQPPIPSSYTISLPLPGPVPPLPRADVPSSAIGRLESLLGERGAEDTEAAWRAGVSNVHAHLTTGVRKLAKPMRLGLVIKILKAGWVRDGTWPVDKKTKRPLEPPDSPFLDAQPAERREGEFGPPDLDLGRIAQERTGRFGDTIPDNLIGEDDLHVGTNVWRGAEGGMPTASETH